MSPLAQSLHALLFLSGAPVRIERLAKLAECSPLEAKQALDELATALATSGLALRTIDDGVQLVTAPTVAPVTERFAKDAFETNLSKGALETLTIILYKGPLTRAAIDYIRGMNSQYALQTLLVRGIIERTDNPNDARSYLYTASRKFCDYVGILDKTSLPEFAALHTLQDENIASALKEIEEEKGVDA